MIESFTTPGTVLLGKYRIVKVLGKGALGVVVAAIHLDCRAVSTPKF